MFDRDYICITSVQKTTPQKTVRRRVDEREDYSNSEFVLVMWTGSIPRIRDFMQIKYGCRHRVLVPIMRDTHYNKMNINTKHSKYICIYIENKTKIIKNNFYH